MMESISKIVRKSRQMLNEIGREPTPEELAEKLGMPLEKVRKVLNPSTRATGNGEITLSPAAVETPRPPLRDGNSPPVPSMGTGVEVETFQLMMNAKDLPSVELVDYTFVF
jgi:hypothetical protein